MDEHNQEETLSLFKSLVRIPSLSHQEKDIADFLESHLGRLSLSPKRHDNNIYVTLESGLSASPCLLLNSHLDVVPPSSNHPYPPFEPTEIDHCIYGRGTVDAKASGTAMLRALTELHEEGWRPQRGCVIVALTTCEEVGGSYNGLQQLRPILPSIDAALVGEPTSLQPCISQKGLLILYAHGRGQTAHAARSHLGTNAIYASARDIERIQSITFNREDPFLGSPTIAVTIISGGETKNVIPDICTITLDIRSTPAYTHEEIVQILEEHLESDIEIYSSRIIPVSTQPSERIVRACLHAIPEAAPFGSPTTSDWIHLHDVPTVKIGPGPSERSHTPYEHIEIEELIKGVSTYKQIIKAYFASTPSPN